MGSLNNILLIGSTGTIGSALRKSLVARKSAFEKVGVLTGSASLADPKKAEAFQSVKSEGVEIVVAELDDKSGLVKALKGNQFDIPLIDD
jgi:nucleoside-diphosphate-sugar epimerase